METKQKNQALIVICLGILVVILIGLLIWKSIRSKQEERRKHLYVSIEETDPKMHEAIGKARGSIDEFIAMLQNPKPTISYFALKAKFEENGTIEHVWLNFITCDGKEFEGNVANDPFALKTISFGKTVRVPLERVSDWMIIDNGVLVGGYTLRVLRDRMSEPDKRAFDEKGRFRVE